MRCTKIYHDDLAEQILDRERNPDWQGECMKMGYSFPSDEKKWDRYAQIRSESLRADGDGSEATAYYRRNRKAMDKEAGVAWPARHNADEISAIQHAMKLKLRDEEAFFAEYQNEPVTEQADDEALTPEQVADRFNGRPGKQARVSATCVTAFIDVHARLLYCTVCAWEENFTGYVIDYGTFPNQKRLHFTLRDARRTLAGRFFPAPALKALGRRGSSNSPAIC
jgi:hypothetical protein